MAFSIGDSKNLQCENDSPSSALRTTSRFYVGDWLGKRCSESEIGLACRARKQPDTLASKPLVPDSTYLAFTRPILSRFLETKLVLKFEPKIEAWVRILKAFCAK